MSKKLKKAQPQHIQSDEYHGTLRSLSKQYSITDLVVMLGEKVEAQKQNIDIVVGGVRIETHGYTGKYQCHSPFGYMITPPDCETLYISNLKRFCELHELDLQQLTMRYMEQSGRGGQIKAIPKKVRKRKVRMYTDWIIRAATEEEARQFGG